MLGRPGFGENAWRKEPARFLQICHFLVPGNIERRQVRVLRLKVRPLLLRAVQIGKRGALLLRLIEHSPTRDVANSITAALTSKRIKPNDADGLDPADF